MQCEWNTCPQSSPIRFSDSSLRQIVQAGSSYSGTDAPGSGWAAKLYASI